MRRPRSGARHRRPLSHRRPPSAGTTTIADSTGREVRVETPVKRVILRQGRQSRFTAALEREAPFEVIVGWRDGLQTAREGLARGSQMAAKE